MAAWQEDYLWEPLVRVVRKGDLSKKGEGGVGEWVKR